jgi:ribosomal protein S18 acetylase RimI-like enzyme
VNALSAAERACLARYLVLLSERLGDTLVSVRLFGSAARGDMWPAHSPMHSDIDLLVMTRSPVPDDLQDELGNETYPLYLECGRQLSPQFVPEDRLAAPRDERERAFFAQVAADGIDVWPRAELRPFTAADDDSLIAWVPDADALRRFGGPYLRWPLDRSQLEAIRCDPALRAFTLWTGEPPARAGHVELRLMGDDHGRLARVGIDPALRGRGLGRVLVAAALAEARRLGRTSLELGVYADNAVARVLYERFGFVAAGPPDVHGIVTMTRR